MLTGTVLVSLTTIIEKGYLQDDGCNEKPDEGHELTNRNEAPVGDREIEELRVMKCFQEIVDTAKC